MKKTHKCKLIPIEREKPYDYLYKLHSAQLNYHYKLPLIGLSETKISIDKEPIPNINIPAYTFISEPSHSNAGGVAFYINDNLKYTYIYWAHPDWGFSVFNYILSNQNIPNLLMILKHFGLK